MAAGITNTGTTNSPRWLHYWAVLTVMAALPLLTLGAEVTSKSAGMADKAPIRLPWHLVSAVQEKGGWAQVIQFELGWLIEHSHRTVAWLVGLMVIVLAIGLWKYERRRWLRWMGIAVMLGVGMQGGLGALRVDLDQRIDPDAGFSLALIHGCSAQIVFALLVGIVLWTSSAWESLAETPVSDMLTLRRPALLLVALMLLQITFGALMRHKGLVLGVRLHILLAFVVVAVSIWLGVRAYQLSNNTSVKAVWLLWGLLSLQLFLGLETMLAKFEVRWPYTGARIETNSAWVQMLPSLHFLVGSLTFATASSLAFMAHRHVVWMAQPQPAPEQQLEGVL